MYIIKESGKGKLYCYTKGAFALNDNLKQSVLKQLFNDKCPHIDYERQATTEEASTQFEPVPEENTEDKSNGNARRKANNGKTNKKRKEN